MKTASPLLSRLLKIAALTFISCLLVRQAHAAPTNDEINTSVASNYSAFSPQTTTFTQSGDVGWGAWTGNDTTTNSNSAGGFLGAAPSGTLIGSGNIWSLYSNSGQTASVYRAFNTDIIGDTVSVDVENTQFINGSIGWSLWNASQQSLTEFYFSGGQNNWSVPTSTVTGNNSTGYQNGTAIQSDITITGSGTFSTTAKPSGGTAVTTSGNFTTVSSGNDNATGTGLLFRFFSYNNGSNNNIYYNNLYLTIPTYTNNTASQDLHTASDYDSTANPLNAAPITGNNIAFLNTTGQTITNTTNIAANALIFRATTGADTISYGTTNLGDTGADNTQIRNDSSNLQTVNGAITLGASALAWANTGNLAIGASIALGGFTLTGTGANQTTFSNNITGSGAVAVNQGTTIVSGSISGTASVTIASGATLELDGSANIATSPTINGTLKGTGLVGGFTAANGSTLAPGLTVANAASTTGTLTAKGAITLSNSTGNFSVRLGYGSGGTYDQLSSNSTVNLNGATIALTLGGPLNSSANLNDVYQIISSTQGSSFSSGTFTYNNVSIANGGQFTVSGGFEFTANYNVNEGGGVYADTLTLAAIPEPGTIAAFACGAGLLLAMGRRRRRS